MSSNKRRKVKGDDKENESTNALDYKNLLHKYEKLKALRQTDSERMYEQLKSTSLKQREGK